MKTTDYNTLKQAKTRRRLADLRTARRQAGAGAEIQRRVSLTGGGAKWRIANLNQVARAIARW